MFKIPLFAIFVIFSQISENSLIWSHTCKCKLMYRAMRLSGLFRTIIKMNLVEALTFKLDRREWVRLNKSENCSN